MTPPSPASDPVKLPWWLSAIMVSPAVLPMIALVGSVGVLFGKTCALQAIAAVLLIGGVLYGMACEMAGRAVFWPDNEMRPE